MLNSNNFNQETREFIPKRTLSDNITLILAEFVGFLFSLILNSMGFLSFLIFNTKIHIIVSLQLPIYLVLSFWLHYKYNHFRTSKERKVNFLLILLNTLFFIQMIISSLLQITYLQLFASLMLIFIVSAFENCNCNEEEELNVIIKFFVSIY